MNEDYYTRLAEIESGGNPKAKNPKSSASGLFQFTESTAKQYGLTDPTDPILARQAVEKFTTDNAKSLQKALGREPTQGELYLAHQQGAGGAQKLLSNPDKRAIEVLGVDQVLNNGGDENMTAKEFSAKWTGKFGNDPVSIQGGEGQKTMIGNSDGDKLETLPVKTEEQVGSIILLPDGGQIQLTGQETPEIITNIKRKIVEKYGSTMAVDRESGAPANVRAVVGSVTKPEDRLATLRKYYPEAIQYGDDNFVFVDPNTGKSTLYNPKGLDLGDFASIGRELAVTGGSIVGAAGGAAVGLGGGPVAPASVPAGAIVGSGFGTMAAGSAFDMLLNTLSPRVDSRTITEKQISQAADFASGAIGEGVGRGLSFGAKKILGGGTATAQKVFNQMKALGIRPSSSVVSDGAFIGKAESALSQSAGGADILQKQATEIVEQTHNAVKSIVAQIGEPKTDQGAGGVIVKAAKGAAQRFGEKQEKLYDAAFDLIGGNSLVKVDALKELRLEMAQELMAAPGSLKHALGPALAQLDNIIADAGDDGLEFGVLRQIRTNIGRDLAEPLLTGSTSSQNEAMKRIYASLSDDMTRIAISTSDDAAKKLKTADRFTRMWANTAKDTMNKIGRFDADEKAFRFALSSSRDGGTSLARLRRNFTAEEWDTVAASVLNQLGDANAGMQNAAGDAFSVNTFLTNYNKLAPEAKTALFGGPRYKSQRDALDGLLQVMEGMKDVSRFQNTSNTAGAQHFLTLIGSLAGAGGAGGFIVGGDPTTAAGGVATAVVGGILAPRAAAKLITNPAFVEWLASPVAKGVAITGKKAVAQHMARLMFIAETNPEIRDEIDQFVKQLDQDTAPDPIEPK